MKYQKNALLNILAACLFASLCLLEAAHLFIVLPIGLWPSLLIGIILSTISLLTLVFCHKSRWGQARRIVEFDNAGIKQIDEIDSRSFYLAYKEIHYVEIDSWSDGAPEIRIQVNGEIHALIELPAWFRNKIIDQLKSHGVLLKEKRAS